jgi:DNA-binding transcriptional regulator YiaG
MKKKKENELPILSAAVKSLRAKTGLSQEAFARRIRVAVTSVSRFETGRMEPRESRVLGHLAILAHKTAGAEDECKLFTRACSEAGEREDSDADDPSSSTVSPLLHLNPLLNSADQPTLGFASALVQPTTNFMGSIRSLREWRLLFAARLAMLYYPEQAAAMEKAAGAAIALVDEVLSKADENQIDYALFEREIFTLADRRQFSDLKHARKEEQ